MKFLSATILLNVLTLYGVCANDGVDPEPNGTNGTSTASPTSTLSTTISTTPASSTTTATTSTAPSNTSTTKTTTVAPSTPTGKPTSTGIPTSTEIPTTPAPVPKSGTWEVKNSTNASCIVLKMVAELQVYFNASDNKSHNATVFVPSNATADGSCGNAANNNQTLKLQWSFVSGMNNTMEFVFSMKDNKFELDIINITLTLDPVNFQNATVKTLNLVHKQVDFATPVYMSYKCDKEQQLDLYVASSTNSTISGGSLKISEFQFQAFGNITNKHFANAKNCEPYETPDIVPIAVGCALMALIVIVLVGYLIGRRRNQARGYLSM